MEIEKQYLIFIGDKQIFADDVETKNKYIKGLKSWEYLVYKREV